MYERTHKKAIVKNGFTVTQQGICLDDSTRANQHTFQ